MTFWVTAWLRAFGLTVLLEAPIAVPLLARAEPRWWRRLAGVVVANLATHPLVWFLFPGLALGRGGRIAASETWAFAAEAAIYLLIWPALGLRRATLVSLLANAASALIGAIVVHALAQ